jgi:hypothetical protein
MVFVRLLELGRVERFKKIKIVRDGESEDQTGRNEGGLETRDQ